MSGFLLSNHFAFLKKDDFSHSPRLRWQEHGKENQCLCLEQCWGKVERGKAALTPARSASVVGGTGRILAAIQMSYIKGDFVGIQELEGAQCLKMKEEGF